MEQKNIEQKHSHASVLDFLQFHLYFTVYHGHIADEKNWIDLKDAKSKKYMNDGKPKVIQNDPKYSQITIHIKNNIYMTFRFMFEKSSFEVHCRTHGFSETIYTDPFVTDKICYSTKSIDEYILEIEKKN